MTEQEAKTLPLWEVWERLRAALDMIEMDDPNAPDTTMGGKWGTPPGEYGRMAAKMVQPIRAVLLERCSELVDCTEGHFSINHNLILKISHGEIQAFKDASAIFAFWAWELEQLGKEAKGGD